MIKSKSPYAMVNKNDLGWCLKVKYVAVLQMSAGGWFQACGRAAMEKALEPNTVRDRGT